MPEEKQVTKYIVKTAALGKYFWNKLVYGFLKKSIWESTV